MLGVTNGEELANDREAWRDLVVAAKSLNGKLKKTKVF